MAWRCLKHLLLIRTFVSYGLVLSWAFYNDCQTCDLGLMFRNLVSNIWLSALVKSNLKCQHCYVFALNLHCIYWREVPSTSTTLHIGLPSKIGKKIQPEVGSSPTDSCSTRSMERSSNKRDNIARSSRVVVIPIHVYVRQCVYNPSIRKQIEKYLYWFLIAVDFYHRHQLRQFWITRPSRPPKTVNFRGPGASLRMEYPRTYELKECRLERQLRARAWDS